MRHVLTLTALVALVALLGSPAGAGGDCCRDWYGYSPGYWKNHTDYWPHGVDPCDDVCDHLDCGPCDVTMLEALRARGGGMNALLRMGAAAYLNTMYRNDYVLEPWRVQLYFCRGVYWWNNDGNWEYWKNLLETWD